MRKPHRVLECDVLVFGGGMAGLWLAGECDARGYSVILLEPEALGGVQTLASQGVIHGGLKYALNGVLTDSSETIKDMPARWRGSLEGSGGGPDLRGVPVLSERQIMWSGGSLSSRVTAFFAGKTLASRLRVLSKEEEPEVFRGGDVRGAMYEINEFVLDIPAVVRRLAEPLQGRMLRLPVNGVWAEDEASGAARVWRVETETHEVEIKAGAVVLAAGAGNEGLMGQMRMPGMPAAQRRPLHQLMIRHPDLKPFYSVCVGAGTKPVLVSTTHVLGDGCPVWYIGGEIAEQGIDRTASEQIDAGRTLLRSLMPWVNLDGADWATCLVDRAEPAQGGERPGDAFAMKTGHVVVCWPVKMAMVPRLADRVMPMISEMLGTGRKSELPPPGPEFIAPPMGLTPWEKVFS